MPTRTLQLPLLTSFQREATKALAALHGEITQREKELAALKAEAARWQSMLRGPARGRGPIFLPRARPSKRPRLDWSAVLQELPPRFTTKDIAQKTGKPIAHVYHRAVKRVARPMLGFKSFWAARCTIVGIEVLHAIRKGQLVGAPEMGRTPAEQFYSLAA